jgi:ubiquinone biosynthesis protein COQ9
MRGSNRFDFSRARALHSGKQQRFSMSQSAFKTRFLLAALPEVPFDGWTEELMDRTAARLRIPHSKMDMEFPGGANDLADYFSFWATEEAVRKMKKSRLGGMRVRDRITLGVRALLEVLSPHKQAAAAALSPARSLSLPRRLWHAADKIWWAAGDTATDYNHYTKRALLSGVIASTALYWLNDTSKGHAGTWAFLDRRIDNVLKIGMKISKFKKKA